MNIYRDTLQNLKKDYFTTPTASKTQKYRSYENYLHQSNKRTPITSNIKHPQRYHREPILLQDSQSHIPQNTSNTKFYPVERKVVDYVDREVIQSVPVTKKMISYEPKKEIQEVPIVVTKTDYYAIEHVRKYIKQVIPETKIQIHQVPKVVKKIEYQPRERQIIYYPDSKRDLEEIKAQAEKILAKDGMVLKDDAIFRPKSQKKLDYSIIPETSVTKSHLLSDKKYSHYTKDCSQHSKVINSWDKDHYSSKYVEDVPVWNKDKYKLGHDYYPQEFSFQEPSKHKTNQLKTYKI